MHDQRYIKRVIVLFDGFTRETGDPTGMERLFARLFEHRDRCAGSRTMLLLREWHQSPRSLVRMIHRRACPNARIAVCGFSWGAGWGAIKLARELGKWGRSVELMLLIDPVWRSRLLSLRWLALTGRIPLRVPWNVERVAAWRQNAGGCFDPKGSKLSSDSEVTHVLHQTICRGMTHHTIQYADFIQEECYRRLTELMEATR